MNEKYELILRQNRLWAIAGLVLPTFSTAILLILMLFNIDTYAKSIAVIIILTFVAIASYWWWWTMCQLYKFTKDSNTTEQKIKDLGTEFKSIKDDIKSL